MSDKKDDKQLGLFQADSILVQSDNNQIESRRLFHVELGQIKTELWMGLKVRYVLISGDPWFFAVDVCLALGLDNPSRACSTLKSRAIAALTISKGSGIATNIVSEGGLNKLVFKSRKPEAERFQDWVTDEVLPAIRKTGHYEKDALVQALVPTTDGDKFALIKMAMDGWAADREKLAAQSEELAIARPAVAQIARIERSVGDESVQTIGKELGVAPNFLFDFLEARGAIFRRGAKGPWKPTAAQINAGRFDMKPYIDPKTGRHYPQMLVTPKGLVWIAKLLDEAGIERKAPKK